METLAPPSRLVTPGTTRLELSQGDWLLVKRRLNAGETMDLFERAGADVEGRHHRKVSLAITVAYLLDWSLSELPIGGVTADEKEAALRLLDFDSLVEIMNAVTAHDTATRQEKKRPGAATGSSAP